MGASKPYFLSREIRSKPNTYSTSRRRADPRNVNNVLRGGGSEIVDRRSLEVHRDFGNILILSMPTSGSCVHVLNGNRLSFLDKESYEIRLIANRSNLSAVGLTFPHARLPPRFLVMNRSMIGVIHTSLLILPDRREIGLRLRAWVMKRFKQETTH